MQWGPSMNLTKKDARVVLKRKKKKKKAYITQYLLNVKFPLVCNDPPNYIRISTCSCNVQRRLFFLFEGEKHEGKAVLSLLSKLCLHFHTKALYDSNLFPSRPEKEQRTTSFFGLLSSFLSFLSKIHAHLFHSNTTKTTKTKRPLQKPQTFSMILLSFPRWQ